MQPSPYAQFAENLRDLGYSPMPAMPGAKIPGEWSAGQWKALSGWSKFCEAQAPGFVHDRWETWPNAGICVAHGHVVAFDLDTDREDIAQIVAEALPQSPVKRRGAKGWAGYYQAAEGVNDLGARIRWHNSEGGIVCEFLLQGTQSVIPPTIHPGTNKPYIWITEEGLDSVDPSDLPEITLADIVKLTEALEKIGITRAKPRRVSENYQTTYAKNAHDLELPLGRSLNNRALDPAALDKWWPALNMPKTRHRGRSGSWEAVASWRGSSTGRPNSERNPNLKAVSDGIVDFGTDERYTPIDVIMHARDCSFQEATEWLTGYVAPEDGLEDITINIPRPEPQDASESDPEPQEKPAQAPPEYLAPELAGLIDADASEMPAVHLSAGGLLADIHAHISAATRREWPEAEFLVAMSVVAIAIGRNYATWTNLRSNLYLVVLARSGWGKSSLYSPATDLLTHAGLDDMLGAERIMSDSGLVTELEQHPEHKKVYFIDEFGHMLQRCVERGAGGHIRKILTEFTNLFSKASGLYTGAAYADGSRRAQMYNPHLCIFGMATPDQFWKAFGSGAIEDGTLARFQILTTEKRPKRKPHALVLEHKEIDARAQSIAPRLRKLATTKPGTQGNLAGTRSAKPEAFIVPASEDALDMWEGIQDHAEDLAIEAEEKCRKDLGSVLARVAENAAKMALIFAVGRGSKTIETRDMEPATRLAWYFAHVSIGAIIGHIEGSEQEAKIEKVKRALKSFKGGAATRSQLYRKIQDMPARELEETIRHMITAQIVSDTKIQGEAGPPSTVYTLM